MKLDLNYSPIQCPTREVSIMGSGTPQAVVMRLTVYLRKQLFIVVKVYLGKVCYFWEHHSFVSGRLIVRSRLYILGLLFFIRLCSSILSLCNAPSFISRYLTTPLVKLSFRASYVESWNFEGLLGK